MVLGMIGAALMVTGFGGAYVVKKYDVPETAQKDRLTTCFHRAKLYLRQRGEQGWTHTYPQVTSETKHDDHEEYCFTLPIGLDPNQVYKHLWVFRQGFGEHIDITGDTSKFTMRVYGKGLDQFAYNLLDIPLEGLQLPVVVGKSREGWVVYDMVENPHLLLAGETGSGKSTELRAILTTMILTKKPAELELYLADLKRSEFHLFKGVEHVKSVTVDKKGLSVTLSYISAEMQRRGDLCDEYGVSHVTDLPFKVPFIVLAIDEVALLKKDKKLMPLIEDIAAVGRALSVFLICSLQRPDARLLESGLKSNLTVRMAFKHADSINSHITIGTAGAEDIKDSERGLMLLKHNGLKKVQSPYLSLPEAKKLLKKEVIPHD